LHDLPQTHKQQQHGRWRLDPTRALVIILVLACALGVSLSMVLIQSRNIAMLSGDTTDVSEIAALLDKNEKQSAQEAVPSENQAQQTDAQQTEAQQRASAQPQPADPDPRIDVNTATSEQLQTLNGVGPVTAQKILDYRSSHGVFSSVDDLLDVPGIGPKTLEKLKPNLRVR
jgi:competence protein ComEA